MFRKNLKNSDFQKNSENFIFSEKIWKIQKNSEEIRFELNINSI